MFERLHRLGDPVEVTVRGYELSLRKADAADDLKSSNQFFYTIIVSRTTNGVKNDLQV